MKFELLVVIAIGLYVAYLVAYQQGRREGLREANKSAIRRGAWIEIVKPVKCTAGLLEPGIQGIITGVDAWGRPSLWIAKPWAEVWGKHLHVYLREDLSAMRTRPLHSVARDSRESTLQALAVWERGRPLGTEHGDEICIDGGPPITLRRALISQEKAVPEQ